MSTQTTTVPLDRYTRAALAEVLTGELLRLRGAGPENDLLRAPLALCEGLGGLADVEDAAVPIGRLVDVLRVLRDPSAQSIEVPLAAADLASRLEEDALYSLREAAGSENTDPDRLPAITAAIQHISALKDSLAAGSEAAPAAPSLNGRTATLPLPAEEAGVLAAAIESHLLGLNLGTPFENEVGLSAGRLEVAKLERVVDRLAFYARTLRAVESRDLVLDVETLGLLDALAGDAVEQKALDAEGHPDDQAISAGREARLRGIREMAAHRVRLAQDGDV